MNLIDFLVAGDFREGRLSGDVTPDSLHFKAKDLREFWLKRKDEAEVIIADNVADWYRVNHNPRAVEATFDKEPFPSVVPPFAFQWIEWRFPFLGMFPQHEKKHEVKRFGCMVFANRVGEWEKAWSDGIRTPITGMATGSIHVLEDAKEMDGIGWLVVICPMVLVSREGHEAIVTLPMESIPIRKDGSCDRRPLVPTTLQWTIDLSLMINHMLLTILSFVNCKNAESREVKHDAKLQKSRIKRGREPLTDYRVIEIKGIGQRLVSEGRVSENGVAKALSICRGHFKTFTPDRPLFGKRHGQFFWAPHVRGDPEKGVVVKDYKTDAQRWASTPTASELEERATFLRTLHANRKSRQEQK